MASSTLHRLPPIFLPDEAATTRFAQAMSALCKAGDCVLLTGPIGAGKTHLSRGLIQHLLARHGLAEDVPSPTFTLVQTYEAGALEIWHADLYRLSHPDDVFELGLDEAFSTALCLIEWPDRLGELAPPGALNITLSPTEDGLGRRVEMTSDVPDWADRLAPLVKEFSDDPK